MVKSSIVPPYFASVRITVHADARQASAREGPQVTGAYANYITLVSVYPAFTLGSADASMRRLTGSEIVAYASVAMANSTPLARNF